MRLKASVVALSMAALIGCGTADNDKNSDNETKKDNQALTAEQEKEKETLGADLPKGTIMIAEVDDKGEVVGEPKLRTVSEDPTGKTQEELITMFSEAGEQIASKISDEDNLDADSSTQSWWGWRYRSAYRCGRWSHCNYRPRCHYRGYNYGYRSVARYQVQGYIPAYTMPYQTYQSFQQTQTFRSGYGVGGGGAVVGPYGGGAVVGPNGGGAVVGPNGGGAVVGPNGGGAVVGPNGGGAVVGPNGGGVAYRPFYPANYGQFPTYGGYQGGARSYQVYGWRR